MNVVCELVTLFIDDIHDMQSWANSFNYSLFDLLKYKLAITTNIRIETLKTPQQLFKDYPVLFYRHVNKYPLYYNIRFNNVMDFKVKAKALLYLDGNEKFKRFFSIYLKNYHENTYLIKRPDMKSNMFLIYDRTVNNDRVLGDLKIISQEGKTVIKTADNLIVCRFDLCEGTINYIDKKACMDWVHILESPFILDI